MTAHIANDRGRPWRGTLRVALYRDLEVLVDEVTVELDLPAHGSSARNIEGLLGRFVDIAWAYRFGPPAQDVVVFSLEDRAGPAPALTSQSFRFPVGRPTRRESVEQLGLRATLHCVDENRAELRVASRRLAYGVRIGAPGFAPDDDAFSVEPGHERRVMLRRRPAPGPAPPSVPTATVTALNLIGRLAVSGPAA